MANQRGVVELEGSRLHFPDGARDADRCADLLQERGVVEKDRLAPEIISLEMPNHDRAHTNRLSRRRPSQESAKVGAAPFVLGHHARFVSGQNAADPHREIRKSFPMFAIPLGSLLLSYERSGNADNVVKAV